VFMRARPGFPVTTPGLTVPAPGGRFATWPLCASVPCWGRPGEGGDPARSAVTGVDAQLDSLLRGDTPPIDTAGTAPPADAHWSLLSACRSDVVTVINSERGHV